MTVRSTESRLPRWDLSDPNSPLVDPGDLGQYVRSDKYYLISYLTSPLLVDSRNDYVVIATEPGATQYAWKVVDDVDHIVETETTAEGTWDWTPPDAGDYWITVTVSRTSAANVVLTLYQRAAQIPGTSIHDTVLEELVESAKETGSTVDDNVLGRAATLCHIDATRELLFELAGYVHQAALATNAPSVATGADRGISARLLAAVVYQAIQSQPKAWSFIHFFSFGPFNRTTELEMAAEEINDPNSIQLTRQVDNDLGVCDLYGATVAMLTGALPWKEMPADPVGRRRVEKEIRDAFEALIAHDQNALIDIFNLLRFPKSNITLCAKLLAQLKNRATRWPALPQADFSVNEAAVKTVVTELRDGAMAEAASDVARTSDASSVWTLMRAPYIATYFASIPYGAQPYGGHTLARGAAGMTAADIQALQTDLRELGFFPNLGLAQINGVFDQRTDWAVREFQIYARMDFAAHVRRNAPAAAEYADRLRTAHNLLRHGGPVSGTVDRETAWKIQFWKARNQRCPVIIQARSPDGITLYEPNVWAHNDVPHSPRENPAANRRRMYARDFSRYYPAVAGRDVRQPNVLGHYTRYGVWGGPVSLVPLETWNPEAEIMPSTLVQAGSTLAQLSPAQRSTFKALRAVSEVECLGSFDCVNAYDNAFVSLGPCHWTLGIVFTSAPTLVEEGELCGFLGLLRYRVPAAFAQAVSFFGIRAFESWVDSNGIGNGQNFVKGTRKFAGWLARQDPVGAWTRAGRGAQDAQYLRNWHWFYRWVMAGRTIDNYRRSMWEMGRLRLRDIRAAPWGAAGDEGIPDIVTGGVARPVTIGDVFTSERAMALLLRLHVYRPGWVVDANGDASAILRSIFRHARTPRFDDDLAALGTADTWGLVAGANRHHRWRDRNEELGWTWGNAALWGAMQDWGAPNDWGDVQESRLIESFMLYIRGLSNYTPAPAGQGFNNGADFFDTDKDAKETLYQVYTSFDWANRGNRHYVMTSAELGSLSASRSSFVFDDRGLSPPPNYDQIAPSEPPVAGY